MSNQKPTIPKGTRDFLPEQMVKRMYILDTIRSVFQRYGFLPLETPAMENLSVLSGKYGDEGEQLIFKILNSGDFLSKVNHDQANSSTDMLPLISEKALRYDLTVPLARVISMYQHEINFPFKRYQIQNVWRADRPQKGRFREFLQCDVDIIGSDSLLNEAELIRIIENVLNELKIEDFTIHINNRKILSGICEIAGEKKREMDVCIAIDKYDKVGQDGVKQELTGKGISEAAAENICSFLNMDDHNFVSELTQKLTGCETGLQGVRELEEILGLLDAVGVNKNRIKPTITLARGLNYYTATIFETVVNNVAIGSISGGGRYDHLIGMFSNSDLTAVGFSFGLDRIFEVVETLGLFPDNYGAKSQVLFVNFENELMKNVLPVATKVRDAGINAEVYFTPDKLKKQMAYADKNNIPYVALIGEEEVNNNTITLKDMRAGDQEKMNVDELILKLKV